MLPPGCSRRPVCFSVSVAVSGRVDMFICFLVHWQFIRGSAMSNLCWSLPCPLSTELLCSGAAPSRPRSRLFVANSSWHHSDKFCELQKNALRDVFNWLNWKGSEIPLCNMLLYMFGTKTQKRRLTTRWFISSDWSHGYINNTNAHTSHCLPNQLIHVF